MKPHKYDYDAILDRWAAGVQQGQIAAALGMKPSAIRCIVRAQRLKGDPRAAARPGLNEPPCLPDDGPTGWTNARYAEAKRLHDQGHSFSKIARAIGGGITTNAVIGMAHRRGWAGRKKPGTSIRTKQRSAKRAKNDGGALANKSKAGTFAKPPAPAPVPYVEPEPVHVPYAGPRYGILDDGLTHFMCRAIVEGSGPTTLFCSAPTVEDSVFRFCRDHAAAYVHIAKRSGKPWTPQRRQTHTLARLRKSAGMAA